MTHKHSVYDTDVHFSINPVTRAIKNESSKKTTLIQFDHNSETFSFDLPRLVEGHDMSLCDTVEIHFDNIDSATNENNSGVYEVKDLQISPDDPEKVVFSWLVSDNATQKAGPLEFSITFECTEAGSTVYRWGTLENKDVSISKTKNNGEAVIQPFPDVLTQWKHDLFSMSNAVSAFSDQNYRNKAGAIVLDAEGESIVVNDASEYPLIGLKLFGKSTQDGSPTPDAPVEIESTTAPTVTVCGKNLLDVVEQTPDSAYIIKSPGELTIRKATEETKTTGRYLFLTPNTTYTISANVEGEFEGRIYGFWGSSLRPENVVNGKYVNTFTTDDTGKVEEKGKLFLTQNTGTTTDLVIKSEQLRIFNIQVEKGTTATEYDPHKEAQTLTMVNTLPGIPVASGGNYTDANGQQWICDEVDLKRGVYVQRVKEITFDGSSPDGWGHISTYGSALRFDHTMVRIKPGSKLLTNQFEKIIISTPDIEGVNVHSKEMQIQIQISASRLVTADLNGLMNYFSNNPLQIVCVLNDPIETPLSDAEINAFKALCTNKPTTTILNDAGAFMAVEYVADTKLYIDRKISELIN